MSEEKRAVIIASWTAIILILIKWFIGIITWSMAIITSALDSILDFFVSTMNFLAIRKSEQPMDDNHHYWHGKIEWFWAMFEWFVIMFSGICVIYFSIQKIIKHETLNCSYLSIGIMMISILITWLLVIYLNRVSKKTWSLILKADSLHYKSDLYTNSWIIVSLIIIKIFNLPLIDPIISILIAFYIIYWSIGILLEGFKMLMDYKIEDEYIEYVIKVIKEFSEVESYHFLRTRKSWKNNFIEFHIVFKDSQISLRDAHIIWDKIELKIIDKVPCATVTIHLDYFDDSEEINNPKIKELHNLC